MTVGELEAKLNEILRIGDFQDFTFNGLNVGNREAEVRGILTAVDYDVMLADVARRENANVIVVHHGLWWGKPYTLTGVSYKLFSSLFDSGINLLAYHLPLDAHPEIGNNAYIAKLLGVDVESLGDDMNIGLVSTMELGLDEVVSRLERKFYVRDVWPFSANGRVGIISGAGGGVSPEKLAASGVRIFITGEVSYPQWLAFKRAGVSLILLGHYQSETGGPILLAKWIEENLGIPAMFVDVFDDAM